MPSATSQKKASTLRLLVLSSEQPDSIVTNSTSASSHPTPFPAFLQILTNTNPPREITTFAGYTDHAPLHLKTKYYETDVSIWCDVIPPPSSKFRHDTTNPVAASQTPKDEVEDDDSSTTTLQAWQDQMTSDAALEVRRAIGGIVLLLPFTTASGALTPTQRSQSISSWTPYIEAVSALRDAIEDDTAREIGSIVVLQDMTPSLSSSSSSPNHSEDITKTNEELLESLEDECLTSRGIMGWDFVSWHAAHEAESSSTNLATVSTGATRNKFGERTGIERVMEVLQGVDWFASSYDDEEDGDGEASDLFDEIDDEGGIVATPTMTDDLDSILRTPFIPSDLSISQQTTSLAQHQQTEPPPENPVSDPHAEVWSALDNPNLNANDNITASDPTFEEDVEIAQLQRLMDRAVVMRERASEMKTPKERERFARREVKRLMEEDGW